MNIVITGGTGFIGSNLCKKLLSDGNKIICIDNNFTGSIENIQDCLENPNFTFINHNVIEPLHLENIGKIDQIYNLACPASPKAYQSDPLFTLNTNILGTVNLLELAKKHNARILLSSTSEVYGDPKISPQIEEYWGNVNPVGIRSCYDEGKRVAETFMMEYKNKYGLDVKIARIFNTYGPMMNKDDGRVVSNFINQCIRNEPITIYGDGEQTRSVCYIDDLLNGLIKLMNNNITNGPINLGNPYELSIKDLAIEIKKITNSESTIIYNPLPLDDPMKRKPDISKAKSMLGWEPSIQLKEGIEKTVDYFMKKML
jgi:UDP-glucuronate decarboxylase